MVKELFKKYYVDNNIDYKFIISSRFDYFSKITDYFSKITINLNTIESDKLYCVNVLPRMYIYDIYSNAYKNVDKMINNHYCKEVLNNIKCGFNFVPESIMTANIVLHCKNVKDILFFSNDIPDNFTIIHI